MIFGLHFQCHFLGGSLVQGVRQLFDVLFLDEKQNSLRSQVKFHDLFLCSLVKKKKRSVFFGSHIGC